MSRLGIYLHVPFCPRRCYYCDFAVLPFHPDRIAPYLACLMEEIRLVRSDAALEGRRAVSLFVGGGTPTTLPPDDLAGLIERAREAFPLAEEAEVSVEANPETVTPELLRTLRAAGVNRLSLGLQAWQNHHLQRLGRTHDRAAFLRAFHAARREGFDNLNVDLIFGLPEQTQREWLETLDRVLELEPEHLSAYGLQVEERTPFGLWARRGRLQLPGGDAEAEMYDALRERMAVAGYEHYELSNFARPGRRSVHNRLYWQGEEYVGVGLGAHGHLSGKRWGNHRSWPRYARSLDAGQRPVAEEEAVTLDRARSDALIFGLRMLEGVERRAYRDRYGVDPVDLYPEEVAGLSERGLLVVTPERLRLSERALLIANQVFVEFVS